MDVLLRLLRTASDIILVEVASHLKIEAHERKDELRMRKIDCELKNIFHHNSDA